MTRYIDADALIKQLHKIANCYIDNDRMEASSGTVRAMIEVKDAPTADVVEVTDKSMIPLVKDFIKDLEKLGGRATCGDIIKSIKR